jgi:predicted Zn-dependent protease
MKAVESPGLTQATTLRAFMEDIIERSPADETEVLVTEQDGALTRFANNGIHQNVAERNATVRVRVVKDGKTGVASLNQLSAEAARGVLARAIEIADLQTAGEVVPLPGPAKAATVNAWFDRTANATPEERADFVGAICRGAASQGLKAFGAFSTSGGQVAIANSKGVFHHHRGTQAAVNTVVMGETGSGYADRSALDVASLDGEELAEEVIDKAQRNQQAEPVEPGVYEVVLEEYAVGELLEFMSYVGFSALALQEERSFMRLNERITGEKVTIWDDGIDPNGIPAPFDFEGVPRQRVDLIRDGVAVGVVYDQQTAARERRQSTGHGLPAPNTEGPYATNLFMAPGSVDKSRLAEGIKRGIWVTRFWYVRVVQPKASIITGMTREGTFLIEDGKLTRPVKDLRFTESMLEALAGTVALSSTTKLQASEYFGATRVPAVRLQRFTFTS